MLLAAQDGCAAGRACAAVALLDLGECSRSSSALIVDDAHSGAMLHAAVSVRSSWPNLCYRHRGIGRPQAYYKFTTRYLVTYHTTWVARS